MLKIVFLYHLSLAKFLLRLPLKNSAFDQSVHTFFNHQSFRFPKKATSDPLIVIRIAKRILFAQFKQQANVYSKLKSNKAIFDSNTASAEFRINYVEKMSLTRINSVYGRTELIKSANPALTFFILFFTLISLPALFLFSFFVNNKLNIGIWLLNLMEALSLNFLLKKDKITDLYFFNAYENDANLLALVLQKNGFFIHKITSEVPLQFWNKIIVANDLNLCFHYQQDEYQAFKKTMFVDKVNQWIPETALLMDDFYRNKTYPLLKNTIGFYSSGMWLRKQMGDIDLKDNAYQNEISLLTFLINYVNQFSENKLIVFLHPIEKRQLEKTKAYYASLYPTINFAPINTPNDQQFFAADVAVTLYSTLSYGRLFWGYKTLIFPMGISNFPLKESSFNNICIQNEEDLKLKLKQALAVNASDFFLKNGLQAYTYINYFTNAQN